eukprot:scaffold6122_cov184-Amphora_coffeaeformis.AAC.3
MSRGRGCRRQWATGLWLSATAVVDWRSDRGEGLQGRRGEGLNGRWAEGRKLERATASTVMSSAGGERSVAGVVGWVKAMEKG